MNGHPLSEFTNWTVVLSDVLQGLVLKVSDNEIKSAKTISVWEFYVKKLATAPRPIYFCICSHNNLNLNLKN